MFLCQHFPKRYVLNPVYQHNSNIRRQSLRYIAHMFKYGLKMWLGRRVLRKDIRCFSSNLKIIVGSASTKQEGWISTNYPLLDLTNERSFAALFQSDSVDNFLAEHVWEHLTQEEGALACKNCFAFLKQGGNLRIAVPDGFHPDMDYIAQVKPGGYGPGADDHKVLYNYRTLSKLLSNAGFKVTPLEWFDEQGEFRHENWDNAGGFIMRSTRFDPRNRDNPTAYTSLIIDARKA